MAKQHSSTLDGHSSILWEENNSLPESEGTDWI